MKRSTVASLNRYIAETWRVERGNAKTFEDEAESEAEKDEAPDADEEAEAELDWIVNTEY